MVDVRQRRAAIQLCSDCGEVTSLNYPLSTSLWICCGKGLEIIIRRSLIRDHFSTEDAAMNNHPALLTALAQTPRLHQPLAQRCTISRTLFINVFAP